MRRVLSCTVVLAVASTLACSTTPTRPSGVTAAGASTAIVNGSPTGSSYGSVGALLYDFDGNGTINGDDELCTGSLIAPTVFLTAGHCVSFLPSNATLYVSFAPDLYAGGINVITATSFVLNPAYGHDEGDLNDNAVVMLPAGSTSGITPLALPPAGLLDSLAAKGGLRNQDFVNVGYGSSSTRSGRPSFPFDGVRKVSTSRFMSLEQNWLNLLINANATDQGGDCYGDSGGPKFIAGNTSMIVATVMSGDVPCRASSKDYRLDTPSSRAFLGRFVVLP